MVGQSAQINSTLRMFSGKISFSWSQRKHCTHTSVSHFVEKKTPSSPLISVSLPLFCTSAVMLIGLLRYAHVIEKHQNCVLNTAGLSTGWICAAGLIMVGNFQVMDLIRRVWWYSLTNSWQEEMCVLGWLLVMVAHVWVQLFSRVTYRFLKCCFESNRHHVGNILFWIFCQNVGYIIFSEHSFKSPPAIVCYSLWNRGPCLIFAGSAGCVVNRLPVYAHIVHKPCWFTACKPVVVGFVCCCVVFFILAIAARLRLTGCPHVLWCSVGNDLAVSLRCSVIL